MHLCRMIVNSYANFKLQNSKTAAQQIIFKVFTFENFEIYKRMSYEYIHFIIDLRLNCIQF